MTLDEKLAREALALVGIPFRLHGRDPRTGLDCVGLVACSLARMGRAVRAPEGYALRNSRIARYLSFAEHNGLTESGEKPSKGAILLVKAGPAQHHLLIATGRCSFVHAHAGLRQVVEQHGPIGWPIEKQWRLRPHNEE